MRIGLDGRKIPEAARRGPVASLDHARELGVDGLFFRTVLEMSPTLDPVLLGEIRQHADELDMYLETGLGKVNPFATPETPELRAVGDGDIVLGFRRMMEACAAIGCRELWVGTANYKVAFNGRWAYDRFRTDVTWAEQLRATRNFLEVLAPIARDLGIHLNLELHEEITSFELIRLVEAVGPDVLGVVFDVGNGMQRVEHPLWAARRLAPYIRQTHMKDAHLARVDGGVLYQTRPCGEGVVDFAELLTVISEANPGVNLTVECDQSTDDLPVRFRMLVEVDDEDFLRAHPDLTVEELAAYLQLVHGYEERIRNGEVPDWTTYAAQPFGYDEAVAAIRGSVAHLRAVCVDAGLPLEGVRVA